MVPAKPLPSDWPRMSSGAYYLDAAAAIEWLCAAFGFETRLKVEDDAGRIIHSELEYGGGVIQVGEEGSRNTGEHGAQPWRPLRRSPKSVGGANTQMVMVYVDDVDAHCARARASGATILEEPAVHDYGEDYWADKSYGALDCEGHMWWFSERLTTKGKT